jgi:membrane protease YdiL (CAAX protease family)
MIQLANPPDGKARGQRLAVLVEGGLGVVAVLLAWLLGVPLMDQFPSNATGTLTALLYGVLATLPLVLMFWFLVRSRHPELRRLSEQVRWLVEELFGGANLAQLALVAGLAGLGEELLFRGTLLPLVSRWTTPLVAQAATSLLFGLAHALSRLYFLVATLIGVYFGWLAMELGLTVAIVAHGLYDLVALVYLTHRSRSHPTGVRRGIER